jgi:hypothetical protein
MAKVLYTAEATVTCGRAAGHGRTSHGALDVQLGFGLAVGLDVTLPQVTSVLPRVALENRGHLVRGGDDADRVPGVAHADRERPRGPLTP